MLKRLFLPLLMIIAMATAFNANAQTRLQVGVVAALSGKITVSYQEIGREAVTGEKIYMGDVIETTASSKMQILLKDRTALTIAPSSRLVIDEFIYDPGVEQKLTSTLFKGVVKMSSPRLQGAAKSDRKLVLPNAVVAIRGTEFLARVGDGDDQVILFSGLISVENPQFIRDLAKPNFGVSISDDGQISVPQFIDDKALGDILTALEPTKDEKSEEAEGSDTNDGESDNKASDGETGEDQSSDDQSDGDNGEDGGADSEETTEDGDSKASDEQSIDEQSSEDSSASEDSTSEGAENETAEGGASETEATESASAEPSPASSPASAPTETSTPTASVEAPAVTAEVEVAPIEVGLDGLTSLASVETAVETPMLEVASISIDNQITQELNEVLETVSEAVTEDETSDPATTDSDGDGVVDSDDVFPNDATETIDTDGDGIGNNADTDDDGDGVADSSDPNPLVNDTLDTDSDGTLDIVDTDDDGDGVADSSDAFPLDSTESVDTDGDGIGNNADSDDDGDGVADTLDPNPLTADTLDTDGDGTLDIVDTDDDGDGVPDSSDAFPLDGNESADSDGDGTGDNADTIDNSRLYAPGPDTSGGSYFDNNEFTSTTWSDLASQIGTGTATFSKTDLSASVVSGSGCPGCTAQVDTTVTIDFSDMDYQFNSEVDFTKPGYEVVTFTQQSGTIPLGQREFSTGSLYTPSSNSGINDLESQRNYDNEYTFTSTSDSSVTISKELDVTYYYHGDLSDSSDMDATQFGVHGYTKILYGNSSDGDFTQLNTDDHALDPQ